MNAAARAISQSNVFNGQLFDVRISKKWCLILILLTSVLVSALSVVYTTNEHRSNFSHLQQLESQKEQLKLQRGRLLLEQASLATPARVEELAAQKLQMQLPADRQTFVLKPQ